MLHPFVLKTFYKISPHSELVLSFVFPVTIGCYYFDYTIQQQLRDAFLTCLMSFCHQPQYIFMQSERFIMIGVNRNECERKSSFNYKITTDGYFNFSIQLLAHFMMLLCYIAFILHITRLLMCIILLTILHLHQMIRYNC